MSLDDKILPSKAESAQLDETPAIDPKKAAELFERLVAQQNLPMGFIAGFVASIVGAIAWAAATVLTGYQIGWLAVGVGFLVGVAVRYAGRGLTKSFGIVGGGLALFGCLLGNFLAMSGLVAHINNEPILETTLAYATNPEAAMRLMQTTFSPMDLLFYGIAVYEGYRFSFREISDEDLNQMIG